LVKSKRLKLQYATQVGARPIRIKLFVSDAERVVDNYERYLVNTLRSAFGLEGAPIRLIWEGRRQHEPAPVMVAPEVAKRRRDEKTERRHQHKFYMESKARNEGEGGFVAPAKRREAPKRGRKSASRSSGGRPGGSRAGGRRGRGKR
jgi:hypothetical protein